MRVAASALVHKGVEAESIRSIADIVSLERFKLILRFLLDRHDGKTSPQVAQIAAFLKGVAAHWVKVDDLTLLQIQKLAARLSTGRRGLTAKNRERLRPFDDPQTVAQFLGLPQRIRREVERDTRAPERKAIMAQMATAIALLQVVPLRLGNLAKIDLRKNLIARGKRVYLVVPEGDTKNGEPVDFELPGATVDVIGLTVRPGEYRPYLLRGPTDALFSRWREVDRNRRRVSVRKSRPRFFDSRALRSTRICFATPARRSFLINGRVSTRWSGRFCSHRSIETTSTSFYAGAGDLVPPDSTMRQ